ncbi:MAG TPA: hypothetical protein DHM37_09340 [Candidatus Cloacimonas sp.]|jgi:hypothetical protein|nr:hypothetical protein [Candidatus Cloacimonadota bacterium]HCX73908.1 hypothetical protein [Candidatus Cloacimonas sp.]
MLKTNRVIIATIVGLILGLLFSLIFKPALGFWKIFLTAGLLGFVLGISALRISWWLHGIIMGVVVTLPMAVVMAKGVLALIVGLIIGFLIELITAVIFRAQPFGKKKEVPVE